MTEHDDNAARMFRTGHYNAYDGKGWQKCDEGLPVWESNLRDKEARGAEHWRSSLSTGEARFVVGQTISTLEEYEALPVGATVYTQQGMTGFDVWHWVRVVGGYSANDELAEGPTPEMMMADIKRVIRSLPLNALA